MVQTATSPRRPTGLALHTGVGLCRFCKLYSRRTESTDYRKISMPDPSGLRILTTPTVYLLGRQELQQAELDRFLGDHGVRWSSDSEVAAEVVTETAGRVCYMSFAKPRPGGNSAYLHHIKEVGHGSVFEHAVWNFLFTGISR